jgi:histidinol phosphatase-like PHP family hydrolase
MAEAAMDLGYAYLALTDHSASHGFGNNVTAERLWKRIEEVREFNEALEGNDFRLLVGSEVNIGTDGSLDYDDDLLAELDWVIASIHTSFRDDAGFMTSRMITAIEHSEVDCIGHPTGRLLTRRDPYPLDIEKVIEAAAASDTAMEINGNPHRRDLSDVHARLAAEAGVKIVLNTDAHAPVHFDFMVYAVATARRAWLEPNDVLNTGPWWKEGGEEDSWIRRPVSKGREARGSNQLYRPQRRTGLDEETDPIPPLDRQDRRLPVAPGQRDQKRITRSDHRNLGQEYPEPAGDHHGGQNRPEPGQRDPARGG